MGYCRKWVIRRVVEGTKQEFHSFVLDKDVVIGLLKLRFEQNFAAPESFLMMEQLHF